MTELGSKVIDRVNEFNKVQLKENTDTIFYPDEKNETKLIELDDFRKVWRVLS